MKQVTVLGLGCRPSRSPGRRTDLTAKQEERDREGEEDEDEEGEDEEGEDEEGEDEEGDVAASV